MLNCWISLQNLICLIVFVLDSRYCALSFAPDFCVVFCVTQVLVTLLWFRGDAEVLNMEEASHLSRAPAWHRRCSDFSVGRDPTLWSPHMPLSGRLAGSHHTPLCGWTWGWPSVSPPASSDDSSGSCQEVRCCRNRETTLSKKIAGFLMWGETF